MPKKKVVIPKKKRGRPFTGADNRDPVMAIRLALEMRAENEAWAASQPDHPDRSEAIRRLLDAALARARKGKR